MAGRKVFNEQDARRCLGAVKASGGGLGAWARTHGVDGRSLNLWRVNLERRGTVSQRAAAPRLVELVVATNPPVAVPRAAFVVGIGGVEVQVPEGFDEASLRRLVAVLKSC
jgi:transposase-like protein